MLGMSRGDGEVVFPIAGFLKQNTNPKSARQVYNIFQDLWNKFIILEGG